MWQRVQTLYIARATALIAVLFFCNMAASYDADGNVTEYFSYTSFVPYLILTIVLTLLGLLSLTTFKVRIFQMRTAGLAAILALAFQIWLVMDFIFTGDTRVFRFTAIFPIISSIFFYLAARAILSDQLLVESASHLRRTRRR